MSQMYYARPLVYRNHICWAERRFPGDGWTGVTVFKGKPSWTPMGYPTSQEAIAAIKVEIDRRTADTVPQPGALPMTWQNGLFDL